MKFYSLFILFLTGFSSIGQTENSAFLEFDLSKFHSLEESGTNHYFLEDSTKITLEEYEDLYQLKVNFHNSHYYNSYQYFKTSLRLKGSANFFQHNLIGIHRVYDAKGKLIEEDYRDSAFDFSLEELDKLLIKDYDLHIMDTERPISVSIENSIIPIYGIAYSIDRNPFGMWRFIQFDGKTGEKLQDFQKTYECKSK